MIHILHNTPAIDASWCYDTFRHYIKPTMKVCIVAFSFRDHQVPNQDVWDACYLHSGKYYPSIIDPLLQYGIQAEQIQWINYFRTSKIEAKQMIQEADILYFLGGLPDKTMERLKDFDLMEVVENHPGILMGFSAGAMIQFREYHCTADKDYSVFCYYQGLSLLSSFAIEVHYHASELQQESIARVIREKEKPVYAIEDDGAIIVMDEQIITIGKVHRFEPTPVDI